MSEEPEEPAYDRDTEPATDAAYDDDAVAADEAPDDAVEVTPPAASRPSVMQRIGVALPWSLGVLAIALSVGAGLEVAHVRHANAVADARTQAVAAARSAVQGVLSYDYRHLDQDFAAGRKLLAPGFAKDYEETTKAVAPTAKQYHAVVTAAVSAAGARNVSDDTAIVLLFVDQTSTNTKHAQPRIDQSRVRVTMVKDGGRWLLSKLEAL